VAVKRELYDEPKVFFELPRVLDVLTPSKARKTNLSDIYPPEINAAMSDELKKDLFEMLQCYSHRLWTAMAMMCLRILERELPGKPGTTGTIML
jgi:hypothetical protein